MTTTIGFPPPLQPDAALFLDFDGTLVEIADAPQDVVVAPRLPILLDRLSLQLRGALAIVSGRRIDDVGAFLRSYSGVIVGLHGLEHRAASGETFRRQALPALVEARAGLEASLAGISGVTIEDKGQTIAVHYRGAPREADICIASAEQAVEQAKGALLLRRGKMLVEIGPRDMNKGAGIEALMRGPVFRDRMPVFIGDDVTDEDGFLAVNTLGGISIRVGDETATEARYRLADVPAVISYLTAFTDEAIKSPRGIAG
jgi:trehalose 6-phosphate phosphatase